MEKPGVCRDCDYWDVAGTKDASHGRCHHSPPQAVSASGYVAWPVTAAEDWCSQFKRTGAPKQHK
jgi:hypothetical protein